MIENKKERPSVRLVNLSEKQKHKESPLSFFLLLRLHSLFFDSASKEYIKKPLTKSEICRLISKNKLLETKVIKKIIMRADMQYFLKSLIKKGVLIEQEKNNLNYRDLYILNKKLLRKEIDSWIISQKFINYLNECGVNVILEK